MAPMAATTHCVTVEAKVLSVPQTPCDRPLPQSLISSLSNSAVSPTAKQILVSGPLNLLCALNRCLLSPSHSFTYILIHNSTCSLIIANHMGSHPLLAAHSMPTPFTTSGPSQTCPTPSATGASGPSLSEPPVGTRRHSRGARESGWGRRLGAALGSLRLRPLGGLGCNRLPRAGYLTGLLGVGTVRARGLA